MMPIYIPVLFAMPASVTFTTVIDDVALCMPNGVPGRGAVVVSNHLLAFEHNMLHTLHIKHSASDQEISHYACQ